MLFKGEKPENSVDQITVQTKVVARCWLSAVWLTLRVYKNNDTFTTTVVRSSPRVTLSKDGSTILIAGK